MSESKNIKLHCNVCLGERWHKTLHIAKKEHHEEDDDQSAGYAEICTYRLVECNGCENISLHVKWWCSGAPEEENFQWPPKVSRRKPKWMTDLILLENINNPFKGDFLHEIYAALASDNLRLAVLGIRALLEQIMVESVQDQGNFRANLAKFEAEGFISKIQRAAIEPVVEAGHASMHRGFKASRDEVEVIMDVVENLLESIYISRSKSTAIRIPPRKAGNAKVDKAK